MGKGSISPFPDLLTMDAARTTYATYITFVKIKGGKDKFMKPRVKSMPPGERKSKNKKQYAIKYTIKSSLKKREITNNLHEQDAQANSHYNSKVN